VRVLLLRARHRGRTRLPRSRSSSRTGTPFS